MQKKYLYIKHTEWIFTIDVKFEIKNLCQKWSENDIKTEKIQGNKIDDSDDENDYYN